MCLYVDDGVCVCVDVLSYRREYIYVGVCLWSTMTRLCVAATTAAAAISAAITAAEEGSAAASPSKLSRPIHTLRARAWQIYCICRARDICEPACRSQARSQRTDCLFGGQEHGAAFPLYEGKGGGVVNGCACVYASQANEKVHHCIVCACVRALYSTKCIYYTIIYCIL